MSEPTADRLVEAYRLLREQKAKRETAHKAVIAELDRQMNVISQRLLADMQATNVQSVRTDAGTAFIQRKRSVTITDWPAFIEDVVRSGDYARLQQRCGIRHCMDIHKDTGALPAGVGWSKDELTVQVRAPK